MNGVGPGVGMISLSKTNFQLKNLWMFYINDLSPAGIFGDIADAASKWQSGRYGLKGLIDNGLDLYGKVMDPFAMANLCKRVSLPRQTFETQTHGQTNTKYYSKAEPLGSVSLEFWETESHDIEKYFTTWERKFFNRETKTFKTGNPKRNGYLTVYQKSGAGIYTGVAKDAIAQVKNASRSLGLSNLVGLATNTASATFDQLSSWIPTGVYHYQGLMYKGMEALELDYEEGGGMAVRANFEVDKIIPTELGGIAWTSMKDLAVQGAQIVSDYLGSRGY